MRSEQFVLPLFFSWKVAHRGYRWIDHNGGRRLCAVDALERPDWHGVFDPYQTQQPLLERTGLFREFVELQPSEPHILGFANKFGVLTDGQDLTVDTDFGRTLVHGETLQLWQDEIRALSLAVSLWDAISVGGNRLAAELKAALVKRELPLAVQRALHVTDDDPIMTALSAIQRQTDAHLRRHVDSRLLFRENQPRLQLRLQPVNLLGALWLQFALAVDLVKRFVKCAECGAPFEVSRGLRTGKRPDAKFCSARCRVGHYRGRIEQAQRLRSAGLSPKQIASKLNARVSVINGWLEASPTKPTRRRH
jgi:hypothetical protein